MAVGYQGLTIVWGGLARSSAKCCFTKRSPCFCSDPEFEILGTVSDVLNRGISPTSLALLPDQSFHLAIKKCKIMGADNWDLILPSTIFLLP